MLDQERAGATAFAAALAHGELSATEACEAAIARIEARNGAINAVVVKDYERARAAAAAADSRLAAGERLPLLGVPMTVKESFGVAGLRATWGFAEHADHVSTADSVVVQRLKAAGAVILGKTNVPVALADVQSFNPVYGRTNNPHDHGRTCGGSSGGSAAALASGMVPLEYGTDIGGSIRVPASFCGVYGHKTTWGAVSGEGHWFPGIDHADRDLSVAGPLARDPGDLALALDLTSVLPLPRARSETIAGQRLFLLTDHPVAPVSAEIVAAMEALAARAAAAGATIIRDKTLLPDVARHQAVYMKMLNMVMARGAPGPDGRAASLSEWFDVVDARAAIRRDWLRLFDAVDAVIAPNFGTVAFPHDETEMRGRRISIDGADTRFGDQFGWPGLAILPGLPATSTPVGRDAGGLPIGVQIIGAPYQDMHMIRLAGWLGDRVRIAGD